MKLAIIMTDSLPVPAVKGGAVQTGVQQIIDENEKEGLLDITVFSIYDIEAKEISKKYLRTSFKFIKSSKKYTSVILRILNKIIKALNQKKELETNPKYTKEIKKILKNNDFDHILIKNGKKFVRPISKITTNNLCLQLHNDILNENIYKAEETYNKCIKILVNSNYIKNRVLTLRNAENKNIFIQKNCTDISLFNRNLYTEEVGSLKKKFKINKNETIILFSGRTIPEKGIKELIMAVKALPENMKYKLLIVGSKGFGKETKNKYEKHLQEISKDIEKNIIFTGYIPFYELPKIHAISDIAVVPSVWEEPAGRVVTEAMASGLPVIVSDSGGIADYINDEGVVTAKRDKNFVNELSFHLKRLINDKALRKKMGYSNHLFAQKFNQQRYYNELIEILRSN